MRGGERMVFSYFLESYRSGYNGAVLKIVCPQGHGGSNPSLSANEHHSDRESNLVRLKSPRQPYTTMECKLAKPFNEWMGTL